MEFLFVHLANFDGDNHVGLVFKVGYIQEFFEFSQYTLNVLDIIGARAIQSLNLNRDDLHIAPFVIAADTVRLAVPGMKPGAFRGDAPRGGCAPAYPET